jgi:hypothetical protein
LAEVSRESGCGIVHCGEPADGAATDVLDRNRAAMRRMVEMFVMGNLSDVNLVIAAGYADHQGLSGSGVRGPDGFCRVVMTARGLARKPPFRGRMHRKSPPPFDKLRAGS